MATSRIEGDVYVNGNLSCTTFTPPDGSVTNAAVAASANIAASKLEHRHAIHYGQVSGSSVASATEVVHVVRGATGTVVAVEAACDTAPTGGDRAYTVDVQKSTGGGAFSTILSTTLSFVNGDSDRTIKTATLSSTSLVDGDALEVIVATSGSSGTQGLGLGVVVWIDEDPA